MPTLYLTETHHPIGYAEAFLRFHGDQMRRPITFGPVRTLTPRSLEANAAAAARIDATTVTYQRARDHFTNPYGPWWAEDLPAPLDLEEDLVVSGAELFRAMGVHDLRTFDAACDVLVRAVAPQGAARLLPDVLRQSYAAWIAESAHQPTIRPSSWIDSMSGSVFRDGVMRPPPQAASTSLRTAAQYLGSPQYGTPRYVAADFASMEARAIGLSADRLRESMFQVGRAAGADMARQFGEFYGAYGAAHRRLSGAVPASEPEPEKPRDEDDFEDRFDRLYPGASSATTDVGCIAGNILDLLKDADEVSQARAILRDLGTVLQELSDAAGVEDLEEGELTDIMIRRLVEMREDAQTPKQQGRRVELDDPEDL